MFLLMEDAASSWAGGELKVVCQVLVAYLPLSCFLFVFFSLFKMLGFIK